MPQDVYMEYPDQYGPYPALKDYYNDDGTYSLYDDQRGKYMTVLFIVKYLLMSRKAVQC